MKKRVRTMALGALFCSYWAIPTLSPETTKSNLVGLYDKSVLILETFSFM